MKFVSVAIFAFLCVAAVSAAPAELSEELAFGPFSLLDKLKGYYQKMRCTIEVATKIVSEHKGLEKQLDEMKSNVEYLFNVEWEKCDSAGNKFAVLKCKSGVMVQLGQAFATFTQKVYSTNKELADKIRQETESKCTDNYDLFELDEEAFDSAEIEDFAFNTLSNMDYTVERTLKLIRCAFDFLEKDIAHLEDLRKEFELTKKPVDDLFNSIKKCDGTGNEDVVWKCQSDVLLKIGNVFTTFIEKVSNKDKELARKIQVKASVVCPHKVKDNLFELDEEDFDSAEVEQFALFSISDKLQKYLEKYLEMVRCAFDAIGAEVAENEDMGKAFEETKKDVEDLLYVQWKECDNAATAIGAAKCKFGVIAKLGSTFTKFVQKVSVTNIEMAKRIEQALKQCWKA